MSFISRSFFALVVATWIFFLPSEDVAWADPCGMVPPIFTKGEEVPIQRVGPQMTYVFYRDGLETFIIRPGYEGKIDEFGMLIPFPTPPAIRKAPEDVFAHIAAAVDPPEVLVDLRPPVPGAAFGFSGGLGGGGGGGAFGGALGFEVEKDEVQVVREEAVGMYEVAVLAAGSAKALKKWLEEHKYQYPDGMDQPCNDYVAQGWCFVAVKTRVASKKAADAAPGIRKVDAKLPAGSVFDGHVQAMQFRFPSKELIVPMRLSAFNAGETRNVVYLLADSPAKVRAIPEEYVVRQISGEQLFTNITQPLPLRIIGGDLDDIPARTLRALGPERDPRPHNGVAGDVFAADLLAARTGQLLAQHEEQEKELLSLSETLGLRGEAIDEAINDALQTERTKAQKLALRRLRPMTLTIVDGEFPREVLARENLTFGVYRMPHRRSTRETYDANELGPGEKREGVLRVGSLQQLQQQREMLIAKRTDKKTETSRASWLVLIALMGVALVVTPVAGRVFRKLTQLA